VLKFVRRAAAIVVLPIIAGGAALTFSAAPAEAATPTRASQVITLTNAQRAKAGCKPVRANAALNKAAGTHSRDMATRGYFSHVSPGGSTFAQRARYAGYNYALSENIAWGHQTPAAVVNAWMKSPGHRKNILNCKAKTVGVGVVFNKKGVPYWTQMFGSR
jgi:uncharacterized protein YkwD